MRACTCVCVCIACVCTWTCVCAHVSVESVCAQRVLRHFGTLHMAVHARRRLHCVPHVVGGTQSSPVCVACAERLRLGTLTPCSMCSHFPQTAGPPTPCGTSASLGLASCPTYGSASSTASAKSPMKVALVLSAGTCAERQDQWAGGGAVMQAPPLISQSHVNH